MGISARIDITPLDPAGTYLLCQPGTTTVREPVRGAWMAAPVGPSDGWKRRES